MNIQPAKFRLQYILPFLFMLVPFMGRAQKPVFEMPGGAGVFRIGFVHNGQSYWLDQCTLSHQGDTLCIKNLPDGKGTVRLIYRQLTESSGFIIELSAHECAERISLCWAYGACSEDTVCRTANGDFVPEACRDNVFSTEGNAFTVYYGKVMKLRTVHGITPPFPDIRLASAYCQTSPLALFNSGKKTDAPVIAAMYEWDTKEKIYFCFYKQNAKADYNYFMLPALFERMQDKTDK